MTAAIIVAGGRSARLGRPKQDVVLGAATLLERTLAAVGADGEVVVVGPPRDDLPAHVVQAREDPPLGGPVAAVAAGLAALPDGAPDDDVLVLACDMPLIDRVVDELLRSGPAEAVMLRDRGRVQPLAARIRTGALRRAIAGIEVDGASMHALLAGLDITPLDVAAGVTDDIDRPDDLVVSGVVTDHMMRSPYLLTADSTVEDARTFFADDHVHAALVVGAEHELHAVVVRSDLEDAPPHRSAKEHGGLEGRTIGPRADAELARRTMISDGVRRLAVVDDAGRLLGLLCLKRSGRGFCSDAGVRARQRELAGGVRDPL